MQLQGKCIFLALYGIQNDILKGILIKYNLTHSFQFVQSSVIFFKYYLNKINLKIEKKSKFY